MRKIFFISIATVASTFVFSASTFAFSPYDEFHEYRPPNERASTTRPWWESPAETRPRAPRQPFPALMEGGARPDIAATAPPIVAFPSNYNKGTIIIDTAGRSLYYVLTSNTAYRYPISVGRTGFTWTGTETISRKTAWPDWHPPEEMRKREPYLPVKMSGGIRNPLGAMALYLGNSLYRIHGTNDAKTIGQAASSGCFRMMNSHVIHLSRIADVGTTVKVVNRLPQNMAQGRVLSDGS